MMEELSSPASTVALTFSGRKGAGGRAETEREKNQKRLIELCWRFFCQPSNLYETKNQYTITLTLGTWELWTLF